MKYSISIYLFLAESKIGFSSEIMALTLNTSLAGRLRNTSLPYSQSLMPLFEAVVNSIHAIDERGNTNGKIEIEIIKNLQKNLIEDNEGKAEPISSFKITDNGIGFNKKI